MEEELKRCEISVVDSIAEAMSFGLINAKPFTMEEVIRIALAKWKWDNTNGDSKWEIPPATEPVSVSLEKCARALTSHRYWKYEKANTQGHSEYVGYMWDNWLEETKAVLDAAQVKYHED